MKKPNLKKQILADIAAEGKILVLRNTKATGKVLEQGETYNVPAEVTIEDAFELIAVCRKAVLPSRAKTVSKAIKDMNVKELKAAAKDAGVEGFEQMNKGDLLTALEE